MALKAYLRICTGLEANLPQELRPGNIYFTTDTHKMFVDLYEERVLMASGEPVPVPLLLLPPIEDEENSDEILPGLEEIKEY
ncbi:MAG: hypothetical protein NC218_07490 [Acetobacter sp.]|nr:hypothetical protein [Acetobacter sp.]